MSTTVQFKIDDGIAMLGIDIADRTMNVMTPELMGDLETSLDRVVADPVIRGAIVYSLKSSFLAGADLKALVTTYESGRTVEELWEEHTRFTRFLRRMETCGKPFVAAINGTALGAGLELCLGCHRRIAADNPRALLGLPEVTVGLLPGAGGTQRLLRLIGVERALPLLTQGTKLNARAALEHGLVHAVVEPEVLMAEARAWLESGPSAIQPWDTKDFRVPGGGATSGPRMAELFAGATATTARVTQRNYPAPIAIVSAVYEGSAVPIDAALRIESRYFISLLQNPVARNLTRTMFINKGAADKLARRPVGVPKHKVEQLGILGAGMMGMGIAYVSARVGIEVVLLDSTLEAAERGKEHSRKLLQADLDKQRISAPEVKSVLSRIKPTAQYEELAGCSLIIEAVFEDRAIKADVTRKADAVVGGDAIFASNTSTLPITSLAQASRDAGRFIGLHFFSPVDRMPLVEVILGERTTREATARALDYVQQIRKTPIVVNDSRGFYTSRVFATYSNEGMTLVKDGVLPALIENAARQAGMAVGPLAVIDEVTLELIHKVDRQARIDLGNAFVGSSGDDVLQKMYELERWGKRCGAGFYDYPQDRRKHLSAELAKHFPLASVQPDVEQVKRRLLYVQALDSARCLFEGVLTSPADADIGSILGWGFPAWTGGTVSFIETVGIREFVATCDGLAASYGKRFAVPSELREMARAGRGFYATEALEHPSTGT